MSMLTGLKSFNVVGILVLATGPAVDYLHNAGTPCYWRDSEKKKKRKKDVAQLFSKSFNSLATDCISNQTEVFFHSANIKVGEL